MVSGPVIIDHVSRVAPFGVRFFDVVTGRIITGLTASAVATREPRRVYGLRANTTGIHVLHRASGLREFTFGEGDAAFWTQPRNTTPYRVTVEDPRRQFLPLTFEADLPARGLFEPACSAGLFANAPEGAVPMFSTPNRAVPDGMAAIRAELWDATNDAPAAWAVVTVSLEGVPVGRTLADARGRALVIIPYLEPIDRLLASPETGIAPADQTWWVEVGVHYAPPQTSPAGEPASPARIPDLCTALAQRGHPAAVWSVWRGAGHADNVELGEVDLRYGQDRIVRTSNGVQSGSRLIITPL